MQPLGAQNDDWGPVNVTVTAAPDSAISLIGRRPPSRAQPSA